MTYKPKHRAQTDADIAMEAHEAQHRRSTERNIRRYSAFEQDYCQEFSDCMDGFVIHAPACSRYGDSAMSGNSCINFRHVNTWPYGLSEVR